MTTRRAVLAGGLAFGMMPRAACAQPESAVVTAPAGRFASRPREGEGAYSFRGIRYGRAERFRAPQPVPPVDQNAYAFGPVAPQCGLPAETKSEDCLRLNIWSTIPGRGANMPVMVYFHGGAYSNGSVTDPLNDGAKLAETEHVVVVTVNHRLNAFGYLYLAGLDPRLADSGNLGQLDLILALQWIKANIAAFGGDPNRVMVFGQSGGGAKIATLMGMPAAKGLFHAAATMSGQQVTASGPMNAHQRALAFLGALNVRPGNLQPLLDMSVDKLLEATGATDPILGGGLYFGPVLDMKWLLRHPFWPDANPQSNRIPMILGNTRDETRAFISPVSARIKGLTWDNLAAELAPELRMDLPPEWIAAQYRGHFPQDTPQQIFYRATTAGRSWPGQVIEADARAAAGARKTWVYQLDYQSPVRPELGAHHTADIPLVFGTLGAAGSDSGTGPDAKRVSAAMMAAFASLARTGRPGWPAYTLPSRATMVFDRHSRMVDDPRQWERELFARVPYIQPGT